MGGLPLRASPDHKLVMVAVTPGSPAVEAHVQAGDLLVRMEEKRSPQQTWAA
jgi:C-terminal processing protease CtpA/Prc